MTDIPCFKPPIDPLSMENKLIVDPPSGWLYGFPMELPAGKDFKELLRENCYPEKDIEFAMLHTRQWEEA